MPRKQSRDEKGITGTLLLIAIMVIALILGCIGYQQYKSTLTTTTIPAPTLTTTPLTTTPTRTTPPTTTTTQTPTNATTTSGAG